MTRASWRAIGVAFLLAFPGIVAAQNTAADVCGAGAPYRHCALWLDGKRVRRGAAGDVVGKSGGFLERLPLAALVRGDSAQHYAARYSSQVRRARVAGITGLAFGAATLAYLATWTCDRDATTGACRNADRGDLLLLAGLGGTSFAALIGEAVMLAHATRSAGRALWWHNADFAR